MIRSWPWQWKSSRLFFSFFSSMPSGIFCGSISCAVDETTMGIPQNDPAKGACHVASELTRSSGNGRHHRGIRRNRTRNCTRISRRRAWVALLARSRDGLEAARREVEAAGGRALALTTDMADDDQVEEAAGIGRTTLRSHRIWINNAMVSVLSPAKKMTAEEFRRVTDVTYLGYDTARWPPCAGCAAQPGHDRPDRIRTRLSFDPPAVRLLWSQACRARLHRFAALGADSRREPHPSDDRPAPSGQYAAVQLNQIPDAAPSAARPAHLSTGGGARAIYWAAHHRRRELWVGWPTVKAIVGTKCIPGLLDHYLARVGYASQQTDLPIDPAQRLNNLYEPLTGDYGARGRFGQGACDSSVHLWGDTHRKWLAAIGLGLAGLLVRRYSSRHDGRSARIRFGNSLERRAS